MAVGGSQGHIVFPMCPYCEGTLAFSALITFFHPDPKYSNIIFQLAPLLCNQLGLFDFTDMDVCIEHVILPFARPCKF